MTNAQQGSATEWGDDIARSIFTPWQFADPAIDEPGIDELDAERDRLFRLRVVAMLNEQAPWLVPILKAANAQIAASPGKFFVVLNGMKDAIEIPALGAQLMLLPWADSNDFAH